MGKFRNNICIKNYLIAVVSENNIWMDLRYNQVNKCMMEHVILLDTRHLVHNYQDKDSHTCYLHKLYLKDNLYWQYILVGMTHMDFHNTQEYRCKNQHHFVLGRQHLPHTEMEYKDLYPLQGTILQENN